MLKSRYFFIYVFLCCLIDGKDIPYWIESVPSDNQYYYGIGRIIKSERDYESLADEIALESISKQIYSSVSFSSSRNVQETNDKTVGNIYDSKSTIYSSSFIYGAEKVDSEIFKNEYFVLWRLDKEKHLKVVKKNKEKAISRYKEYLEIEPDKISDRLYYLIPCYEFLYGMSGINTNTELDIDLSIEVPKLIKEILSGLRIDVPNSSYEGIMYRPLEEEIDINVYYSGSKSNLQKISVPKIPIKIENSQGDASFTNRNATTGSGGNAIFKINVISPEFKFCEFNAYIDLSVFRNEKTDNKQFILELERLASDRYGTFELYAEEIEQYDVGHILFSDEIENKSNLSLLRASFRTELTKDGTYNIVMENEANDLIDEWKKENRNCTDQSCQLEIGNLLGVKKLIYNKISFNSNEFACHMFLTDIENGIIEFERNYSREYPAFLDFRKEDDVVKFIKENTSEIVRHFFKMVNRGTLVLSTPISNVTATIEKINKEKWDDPKFEKALPVTELKLLAGSYRIDLRRPGFESKTLIQNIGSNAISKPTFTEMNLELKSKRKSLKRSLIFPGLGQIYQSELGYEKRKFLGLGFSVVTIGALAFAGSSIDNYLKKIDQFETANTLYLNQKILEDVNYHRQIANYKFEEKLEAKNQLIFSISAVSFVWLLSAIDAYFRFPIYASSHNNEIQYAIDFHDSKYKTIQLKVFKNL